MRNKLSDSAEIVNHLLYRIIKVIKGRKKIETKKVIKALKIVLEASKRQRGYL